MNGDSKIRATSAPLYTPSLLQSTLATFENIIGHLMQPNLHLSISHLPKTNVSLSSQTVQLRFNRPMTIPRLQFWRIKFQQLFQHHPWTMVPLAPQKYCQPWSPPPAAYPSIAANCLQRSPSTIPTDYNRRGNFRWPEHYKSIHKICLNCQALAMEPVVLWGTFWRKYLPIVSN